MQPFFVDYLNSLERLHNDIKASLAELPQAGLDWKPGAGMNSLCVIAVHVAGSERYWIGDVVAGEPSGRNREAEFHTQGIDAASLAERLDGSLDYVRSVLEGLALVDLEKRTISPRDGFESNAGWVLAHVMAHTGIHAGHAQMTRQLWEQQRKEQ
jgi:uncharacterized damage-inducible protein DinB